MFGRAVPEAHYRACLYAQIPISGSWLSVNCHSFTSSPCAFFVIFTYSQTFFLASPHTLILYISSLHHSHHTLMTLHIPSLILFSVRHQRRGDARSVGVPGGSLRGHPGWRSRLDEQVGHTLVLAFALLSVLDFALLYLLAFALCLLNLYVYASLHSHSSISSICTPRCILYLPSRMGPMAHTL